MRGLFITLEGPEGSGKTTQAGRLVKRLRGSGKEVVAQLIHRWSQCPNGPLVAANCAGLPESLIESELFGHAKGAFT